jgi:hypothetical protein
LAVSHHHRPIAMVHPYTQSQTAISLSRSTRPVLLGYNQALTFDFRRRAMTALPKKSHMPFERIAIAEGDLLAREIRAGKTIS